MDRTLRSRLNEGQTVYGASCALGAPLIVEQMAMAGLDYLYLDQQHAPTSYDTLLSMLRAAARTPTALLVRVLSNDPGLIGHVLDSGADGVIVPMVNSRRDAERAAAACRYHPDGVRSFGPMRSGLLHGRDTEAANRRVTCLVMIETAEGVAEAEEIAAVPGIDGVYIGQADLALSLGLQPLVSIQPGVHADAIDRIKNACSNNGKVTGINASNGDGGATAAEGFRIVTLGSDMAMVNRGIAQLTKARDDARAAFSGGQ